MKKIITPVIIALLWFSCKNNTPTTATKTETKKTDTVSIVKSDTSKTRLVILFYSSGEGAEAHVMKTLEDSIENYSTLTGKNVAYNKNAWGREGETDYCLKLNELTTTEQSDFISRIRATLAIGKWVNLYENYPCPNHHRH